MRSRFSRGRYELGNATAADLIQTAWGVDADGVTGGPAWLDTDRFDVIATAPAGSTPEMLKAMLRALLGDRFQLTVHADTREQTAYAILSTRRLQLKAPADAEETGCQLQPRQNPPIRRGPPEPLAFACRNVTMAAFATQLPSLPGASGYLLNYRVVDQTGLRGTWDFNVKWSMPNPGAPGKAAGNSITLFDAFENQLGLKLNLTKVPAPVVVVDHVEKATVSMPGTTEKVPARPMEFEVASIKPAAPDARGGNVAIEPGGRVLVAMTLKGLIQEAWGDLNPLRIVGGAKSMDTTQWVVEAKAPTQEGSPPGWSGPMWNGVALNSMRMMLRALLVDRFKLVAHTEDRLISGYALVAAKPKLGKADPANRAGCKDGPGADGKDPRLANLAASKLVTCRNMTLAQFAAALSAWNPEETILFGFPPVVDATGIDGMYDLTINFTPPRVFENIGLPVVGGDAGASEPDGAISIFEALQKQLGLKLESRKVTAQVLVIDHVNEMPTEN